MRIGRQSRSVAQFVAIILHPLLREAAFQKGTRVHSGGRVALEINEVAGLVAVAGVEEMIEADFEQGGQRRIGRDVAADSGIFLVLAVHHGHGVPANQALDAALQRAVAGIGKLLRPPGWCSHTACSAGPVHRRRSCAHAAPGRQSTRCRAPRLLLQPPGRRPRSTPPVRLRGRSSSTFRRDREFQNRTYGLCSATFTSNEPSRQSDSLPAGISVSHVNQIGFVESRSHHVCAAPINRCVIFASASFISHVRKRATAFAPDTGDPLSGKRIQPKRENSKKAQLFAGSDFTA